MAKLSDSKPDNSCSNRDAPAKFYLDFLGRDVQLVGQQS